MGLLPVHQTLLLPDVNSDLKVASHFHQSQLLSVPQGFDIEALRACMHALFTRHDALRLRYQTNKKHSLVGKFTPLSDELVESSIAALTDTPAEHSQIMSEKQWQQWIATEGEKAKQSIRLSDGPLCKAIW